MAVIGVESLVVEKGFSFPRRLLKIMNTFVAQIINSNIDRLLLSIKPLKVMTSSCSSLAVKELVEEMSSVDGVIGSISYYSPYGYET